jgi:hypothetical protein
VTRFTNSNTSMISRSFAIIASTIEKARHELFNPYRPELHYMRGPGPKWHAKNGSLARDSGPRV